MPNPDLAVIVNPISGGGRSLRLLEQLKQKPHLLKKTLSDYQLSDSEVQFTTITTTADGTWQKQLQELLERGEIKAVAVIGGDGTLTDSAMLLTVVSPQLPLFFVPGGRGNDFIRGLYGYRLSDGDFWSWSEARDWSVMKIDLASANGRVFMNMASLGYGGAVVEKAHTRRAPWSKTSLVYQIEGALSFFQSRSLSCEVKVNGVSVHKGMFFGAFLGNGKAHGNGLFWTPSASLTDGLLDVIVFDRPALLGMIKALKEIKVLKDPSFSHQRFVAPEISFHFDQLVPLELDGEFVGSAFAYGFKSLSQAVSVLAPLGKT